MFVYFIATAARPRMVKVGKACDVERRFSELQTGSPYELVLIGSIKCRSNAHAFTVEQNVQRLVRHAKTRGEWFKLTRQVEFVLRHLSGIQPDLVNDAAAAAYEVYRRRNRAEKSEAKARREAKWGSYAAH